MRTPSAARAFWWLARRAAGAGHAPYAMLRAMNVAGLADLVLPAGDITGDHAAHLHEDERRYGTYRTLIDALCSPLGPGCDVCPARGFRTYDWWGPGRRAMRDLDVLVRTRGSLHATADWLASRGWGPVAEECTETTRFMRRAGLACDVEIAMDPGSLWWSDARHAALALAVDEWHRATLTPCHLIDALLACTRAVEREPMRPFLALAGQVGLELDHDRWRAVPARFDRDSAAWLQLSRSLCRLLPAQHEE